jgi:hypothetical protein
MSEVPEGAARFSLRLVTESASRPWEVTLFSAHVRRMTLARFPIYHRAFFHFL